MPTEKTPLLIKPIKDEVSVKILDSTDDINNNVNESRRLSMDELMQYMDDPYWNRIRSIFKLLTFFVFIGFLIAAFIVVCKAPPDCTDLMRKMKQLDLNDSQDGIVSFVLDSANKLGLGHT